jgi:outer membrane receptor protein involved in Fe transport
MDQDWFQDMPSPGFDEITGGLASAFGLPDNLFQGEYNYTLEQLAFYGDLSYALTDQLELGAGVRWFDIDRGYVGNLMGLFAPLDPIVEGKAEESGVTPRFSLLFDATDGLTLYASAAEGFRSGGVNSPEGSNTPDCIEELESLGFSEYPTNYGSDSLWSYELGAKTRTAGGRVQLNTAFFAIDWSDMQTSRYLNCGITFVENAGKANSDGIEFELAAYPAQSLEIRLSAQYNKAELAEDVPNLGGSKGDPIPGVPQFSGSLSASYYFSAFGEDGFVLGSYQYVGKSYNEFDPSVRLELPPYQLVNMRIGLDVGNWSGWLFMNNLFDERGIHGLEYSNIRQALTATPPRTFGVGVRWRF